MAKMVGKFREEIQHRGFNIRNVERKELKEEIRAALVERQQVDKEIDR